MNIIKNIIADDNKLDTTESLAFVGPDGPSILPQYQKKHATDNAKNTSINTTYHL